MREECLEQIGKEKTTRLEWKGERLCWGGIYRVELQQFILYLMIGPFVFSITPITGHAVEEIGVN